MIIYKITNKLNNKCYIGQTSESLEKRIQRHFGYQFKENDTKFYRAIKKYGKENFYYEQIDEATCQKDLDDKEIYWINYFDSYKNGYNSKITPGKCGGDTLSNHKNLKEIKKKISNSKIGKLNPNASKIKCINLETNEIKIFDTIKECQLDMNINYHSIISKRCRHIIKKPYQNKYLFEYIK